MEVWNSVLFTVVSLWLAVEDLRYRSVSLWGISALALVGGSCVILEGRMAADVAGGLVTGAVLVAFGKAVNGAVGSGDGLYIMAASLSLGFGQRSRFVMDWFCVPFLQLFIFVGTNEGICVRNREIRSCHF
ncbi:MAG: hypothetical protein ACLTKI_05445 [Lachnospiraceae bacterium]